MFRNEATAKPARRAVREPLVPSFCSFRLVSCEPSGHAPSVSASAFPGPRGRAMLDELRRYVVMAPRPFVVDLAKSEGMFLATVDGQKLFDWAGYYGAKLIAHNHPRLFEPDY